MQDRLKELFGDRFRVQRSPEDGLCYIDCPSKQAEIYLHSETELVVHFRRTHRPTQTAQSVIEKVPAAQIEQIGDFEAVLVCPLSDAPALLRACGAARKRQVTETNRLASAERLKAFRFQKSPAVQNTLEGLESMILP